MFGTTTAIERALASCQELLAWIEDSYTKYDASFVAQAAKFSTWKPKNENRADTKSDTLDVDQNARAATQVLKGLVDKLEAMVGWEWERPDFCTDYWSRYTDTFHSGFVWRLLADGEPPFQTAYPAGPPGPPHPAGSASGTAVGPAVATTMPPTLFGPIGARGTSPVTPPDGRVPPVPVVTVPVDPAPSPAAQEAAAARLRASRPDPLLLHGQVVRQKGTRSEGYGPEALPQVHPCWHPGRDIPMTERSSAAIRVHEFFEKPGRKPPDLPPPANGHYVDGDGVPAPASPFMPRRVRQRTFVLCKYANKVLDGLKARFPEYPWSDVFRFPEHYTGVEGREGAFPVMVALPVLPAIDIPGVMCPLDGGTNVTTQVSAGLTVPSPSNRGELTTATWSALAQGVESEIMTGAHGYAAVDRVRQESRGGREGASFYESEDFSYTPSSLDPGVLSSAQESANVYNVPLLANTFDVAVRVPGVHGPSTGPFVEDYTKGHVVT
jgi:hypothetical protein